MHLRHARGRNRRANFAAGCALLLWTLLQEHSQNSALQSHKAAERAPLHSRRRGACGFSSVLLAAHVLGPDAGILVILIGIIIGLCSIGNTNHHATLAVGTVAVNATGDG